MYITIAGQPGEGFIEPQQKKKKKGGAPCIMVLISDYPPLVSASTVEYSVGFALPPPAPR